MKRKAHLRIPDADLASAVRMMFDGENAATAWRQFIRQHNVAERTWRDYAAAIRRARGRRKQ